MSRWPTCAIRMSPDTVRLLRLTASVAQLEQGELLRQAIECWLDYHPGIGEHVRALMAEKNFPAK